MSTSSSLAPHPVEPRLVRTKSLEPNPYNPRRLFDREPLKELRESIRRVGVLVPLTVYWSQRDKKYIILDGQRRWMCAQRLRLTNVPVNVVAEPSIVQNIVTMFQIHQLRADWELMPTALTLEILIKETGEKNERRLAQITSLDVAVISRCKKLLTFEKPYQDMMLDPDPGKRVKADFFIELYAVLNDRTVKLMDWFSKKRFTKRMLEKYQGKKSGLKAVTDFRIMKQYINNARKAGRTAQISKRLKDFCRDDNLTLDYLNIRSATVSASARRMLRDVRKLLDWLNRLDPEEYFGEEELWKALEALRDAIQSKLVAADRRPKS